MRWPQSSKKKRPYDLNVQKLILFFANSNTSDPNQCLRLDLYHYENRIKASSEKTIFSLLSLEFCDWLTTKGDFLINLVYFQFSVSQSTRQIWHTNNGIKSNKPNIIMKKARCCVWVQKRVCDHWGSNSPPRAQYTNIQSWVWYHSAIQGPEPLKMF